MTERLKKLSEDWYLMEPALFSVYCMHEPVENTRMRCVVRIGKGRLEYNPALAQFISDHDLERMIRAELIRALLKHPYDRQPSDCHAIAITMGSDCVVTTYCPEMQDIGLTHPSEFGIPEMEAFEWYAHRINPMIKEMTMETTLTNHDDNQGEGQSQVNSEQLTVNNEKAAQGQGDGQSQGQGDDQGQGNGSASGSAPGSGAVRGQGQGIGAMADKSELWDDDELMMERINDTIRGIKSWGSIPGGMVEYIIASTTARIDYRTILRGFRSSVLSSRRKLTRMRPNRRSGFAQMGSVHALRTNLLVAVDVSGSISSDALKHFYSVIAKFFKYGVESIDVVQFDAMLGEVQPMKKAKTDIRITGGGGTSFQPAIDYAYEHQCDYDGLIIITDGYAPTPEVPPHLHTSILWVCENEECYKENYEWMRKIGRVCVIRV